MNNVAFFNFCRTMLKLRFVFALLFVSCSSGATDFREKLERNPPEDLLSYWEYYLSFSDTKQLNSAYVSVHASLKSERLQVINDLAFVKCISERSLLDKSYEMLRKRKKAVSNGDKYLKGIYCLVKARLLFRVNRNADALACNSRAIRYLSETNHTGELKNALLNQGYFYSAVNPEKAMNYYAQAKRLERAGEKRFYVLLRTNLALQCLLGKDTRKAAAYCAEAERFLKKAENDNYLDRFRVLIIQASIAEMEANFSQEDYYLEEAKKLAVNHQMHLNLSSIVYSQSYNFIQRSDYKNAYYALREKDSLSRVMAVENLSEEMAVYDLENKIAIAKAEKQRLDAQFRHERERKQWLLGSSVFLLVLLSGITYLWLGNRRKNRILIQQNKVLAKTEIQRNKLRSESTRTSDSELIGELEKWVFDKALYKQSNLTIERLAKKLNTNRTYLSEAINSHYQTNYSSWINQVRIQAARKMLAAEEYRHYSIEGIAQEVGYTSISSFNSSFKRVTGLTPSQFRKSI